MLFSTSCIVQYVYLFILLEWPYCMVCDRELSKLGFATPSFKGFTESSSGLKLSCGSSWLKLCVKDICIRSQWTQLRTNNQLITISKHTAIFFCFREYVIIFLFVNLNRGSFIWQVEIIAVEPSAEPNRTKVVFAVESDLTTQSLVRDSFMYLISNQSDLHLTTASLFGDPFSFEVLKFRGGITASPEQKAFLMQSGQIRFNFTLNFSIDQILHNFDELRSQLRTGLHLAPYEVWRSSMLSLFSSNSLSFDAMCALSRFALHTTYIPR